ncbi:hypothetical protein F511_42856 [Dorcoceras hygrometricum]|uniref:Uncharacterized protein n=1 Tax=Dorcoceras hygrometricum TaxID=472368 RepID=A0A2Z7AUF9_9LAMI|nr:hypothetical protein F511_42856 [Dorcoceras hygrometricum]
MPISSALLVQPDEGVSDLVVDRIGDNLPQSTEKSRIIVITVGARHKCQRDSRRFRPPFFTFEVAWNPLGKLFHPISVSEASVRWGEIAKLLLSAVRVVFAGRAWDSQP